MDTNTEPRTALRSWCGHLFDCGWLLDGLPHPCDGHALLAENERLRGSLARVVNEGSPDEAWDRAYEEAREHGVLTDE